MEFPPGGIVNITVKTLEEILRIQNIMAQVKRNLEGLEKFVSAWWYSC